MISDLDDSSFDELSISSVEYITDPKLEEVDQYEETLGRLQHFFRTGRVIDAEHLHDDGDDGEYAPMSRGGGNKEHNEYSKEDRRLNDKSKRAYREGCLLVWLTAHQRLAQKKFKVGKGLLPIAVHGTLYPFSLLLCLGYSVKLLQKVYKLYPVALASTIKVWSVERYPISYACEYRNDDIDLIQFMAKKHPEALTTRVVLGPLPIHVAISAGAPTGTIQTLLQLAPQTVGMKDSSLRPCPMDCLSLACQRKGRPTWDYSERIVTLLVHAFCKAVPKEFTCNEQVVRRLHKLKLLTKVMGCPFTRFRYVCQSQAEAQPMFVRYVRSQWSDLDCEREKWPDDVTATQFTMESLLQKSTSVERISFTWDHSLESDMIFPPPSHTSTMLGFDRKLHALSVRRVHFTPTFGLSMLITPGLKSLRLEYTDLSNDDLSRVVRKFNEEPIVLEDVHLVDVKMPLQERLKLLHFAGELQSLESLVLEEHNPVLDQGFKLQLKDMLTKTVVRILSRGRLKTLKLEGFPVDIGIICNALEHNRCLTYFCCSEITRKHGKRVVKLLRDSGCALAHVSHPLKSLPFSSKRRELVTYYTKLNAFGKVRAGNPTISLASFMKLLCAPLLLEDPPLLLEDPETDSERGVGRKAMDYWHQDSLNVFNVQYNLLRQCPALWMTVKRKGGFLREGKGPRKRKNSQSSVESKGSSHPSQERKRMRRSSLTCGLCLLRIGDIKMWILVDNEEQVQAQIKQHCVCMACCPIYNPRDPTPPPMPAEAKLGCQYKLASKHEYERFSPGFIPVYL